MKKSDIKNAKTFQLLDFYNANADRPTKKFADRKTAERRVSKLIEELQQEAKFEEEDCELKARLGATNCGDCGVHLSNGVISDKHNHECMGCGHTWLWGSVKKKEAHVKSLASDEKRSESIAATWVDEDVAAKRKQRSAVEVDGLLYRSTRAAYVELGLPLNDHIQFRMMLKEKGSLEVDGRKWKIIPLNY